MERVVVGMSGGVDSAVCAYLLKMRGYDVYGVTLRTWVGDSGEESRCCEINDARAIADAIDIPYYVHDCQAEFKSCVTDPFITDYVRGITPNPCIECNRKLKWNKMIEMADNLGASYVATGHYATVEQLPNNRYTVKRADSLAKDQTYMLYKLTQEQLSRTLMPLGPLTKEEVRRVAKAAGIPVADKADSQEICFVSDDDYAGYIEANYDGPLPGEGDFVDEDGNVLGRHKGIIHYTVGQRKGLGIAFGHPMYVKRIDTARNEVILSDNESLFTGTVVCSDINMMGIPDIDPGTKIRCRAKVRYRHEPEDAYACMDEGGHLVIKFDKPVRAAAPGQSAVMYDENDCIIGGGIII